MYTPTDLPADLGEVLATVRSWSTPTRPHPATPAERLDRLAGLRQLVDAAQAAFTHALADVDTLGDVQTMFGLRTPTSWLRSAQGLALSPGDAAQQVRIARASSGLLERPVAALAAGAVVFDQVRAIDSTLHTLAAPATASEAVELLTNLATTTDTAAVRRAGQQIRYVVDPDQTARSAEADFARRRLHLSPLLDGMSHLDGLLDAEATTVLTEALAPLLTPAGADDHRTTPQRRADALIDLVTAGVAARGSTPEARTALTVIVDHQLLSAAPAVPQGGLASNRRGERFVAQFAPKPNLEADPALPGAACFDSGRLWQVARTSSGQLPDHPAGGWLLPPATLARLTCDPVLSLLTTTGPVPLQLGREQRLFSTHQRRAVAVRDRSCRWPGCDRPPVHTDVHHLIPWVDGGRTDLDNGLLLCRWHHRLSHEGGWTVTADDAGLGTSGRLWFQPPYPAPPHASDPRGP